MVKAGQAFLKNKLKMLKIYKTEDRQTKKTPVKW